MPSSVVISQVFGGGGTGPSTFQCDFIELFNRSCDPVDISGWSVQAAEGNGVSWEKTDLPSVVIPPGGYLLIQGDCGQNGVPLPTPDVIGAINVNANNGKVALMSNTTLLTKACPLTDENAPFVIDFVGYGSALCFEGAGPAPGPSNSTAILRQGGGCVDTDNNAADFVVGAPTPRNSSTPPNLCPPCLTTTTTSTTTTTTSTTSTTTTPPPKGLNWVRADSQSGPDEANRTRTQ